MPSSPAGSDGAPVRLGVLVSGAGTNLQALLDAIAAEPEFGGEIVVVGSDRADAGGLSRATRAGLPTVVEEPDGHPDRRAWEDALIAGLLEHTPHAIVLAGFMRLVSGTFLAHWPHRVVNTHPSLLPAFRGAHAVRDALDYGVTVSGCTVHLVDEQVDHGPIIAQQPVEVRPDDDEASLHARIQVAEHELLPACVRLLCQGRLHVAGRQVRVLDAPAPAWRGARL